MQGKKEFEQKLFYTISLNQLVPKEHPVRRMAEVLDLDFLYGATQEYYSHEGKPSIDPVVLFKLYLIGYFFGIPSERKLFREIQVNLAYRWYLGYDLDEIIPDHSIMSKSRMRFPEEVFAQLFSRIIRLCKENGLLSGEYHFIDSSLIRADASKSSFQQTLPTEKEYLNKLSSNSEYKKQFSGHAFSGTVDPEKMGKRRERQKKNASLESQTDLDAELVTRPGKGTIPAYKAHLCVDRKRRVILAIDGSVATADDMSKIDSLFTNAYLVSGKKPKTVIADSHYGGIEALKYYQDKGIGTCIPPRVRDNRKGLFKNTDFQLESGLNYCTCPAGKRSSRRTMSRTRYRMQYRFQRDDCNACDMKKQCTVCNDGRIVSFFQGDYFFRAREFYESPEGRKMFRARQIIAEGVIGEAKNNHLMSRCRYRGLHKFRIQLYLTAAVINLKRLMKQERRKFVSEIGSLSPFYLGVNILS